MDGKHSTCLGILPIQVSSITPRTPFVAMVLKAFHKQLRDTQSHQMEWMPSSTILVGCTPIFKLPCSFGVALCFPCGDTHTMDL